MVKEYLSQKGIPYENKDVTTNPLAAQEMVNLTGQRGVPVTLIDNQVVIGFNRPQLDQILSHYRQRPSFGAAIADANKVKTSSITAGAYIGRVHNGSAADRLGLTVGDIIVEMNGRKIQTAGDMEKVIAGFNPGDRISVTFLRGSQTFSREGVF